AGNGSRQPYRPHAVERTLSRPAVGVGIRHSTRPNPPRPVSRAAGRTHPRTSPSVCSGRLLAPRRDASVALLPNAMRDPAFAGTAGDLPWADQPALYVE